MSSNGVSRRDFLKIGATAAAVSVVAPKILMAQTAPKTDAPAQPAAPFTPPPMEFRDLGKTGIKVSAVSLGCMNMTGKPDIIDRALDLGINWFDTARSYAGGSNEKVLGERVKGKRDKVFICTKSGGDKATMLKNIDTSLQTMQTDHVDLWLIHGCGSREGVFDEARLGALQEAKKAGKTRFIGFSSHSNMAVVINAAIESKAYDALLVSYNPNCGPDVKEAIAKAAAAGIGIIAMKTVQGRAKQGAATGSNGLNEQQLKLRWVLDDKNVSCAVPGVTSYKQLEDDVAVLGKTLSYFDRRRLERHAIETASVLCIGCEGCSGTCPKGVSIPDVRRCAMYLNAYEDKALARENYSQIAQNAAPCIDCSSCTARCVRNAALRPIMVETHERLA